MDSRPHGVVPFSRGSAGYRVKRYRERAEELRTIAADICEQECQGMLLRLADTYDQLAANDETGNRALGAAS